VRTAVEILASAALVSSQEVVEGVAWQISIDRGKGTVDGLLVGVPCPSYHPNIFTLELRIARVDHCKVCVVGVNNAVVCIRLLRAEIQAALRGFAREHS